MNQLKQEKNSLEPLLEKKTAAGKSSSRFGF